MVGIHFRNDERHVRLHPEILRVAERTIFPACANARSTSPATEESKAENTMSAVTHEGSQLPTCILETSRRHSTFQPSRRISVALARASLRRRDFDEIEPGMVGEKPDECLAHCAGGTEDCDFPFPPAWRCRSRHDASSVRARRSYVSTLALSSSTSMYSSGVCAT